MKKFLAYAMALAMLFAAGTVSAQKATKKKTKTEVKEATTHLTKSGKADKRFKENKEAAAKEATATKTEAKAESKKAKTKVKEEAKTTASAASETAKTTASRAKTATTKAADQVDAGTKGPHGETVYTGPRGGKYFINKNGKKEYLSSLKKH